MKSIFRILLYAVTILLITSCKSSIEITDGRIPKEYLEGVKLILGSYSGKFEGTPLTLALSLDNDRLRVITNRDLLGPSCNSTVGDLIKMQLQKQDGATQIHQGIFSLNIGNCDFIRGRNLKIGAEMRKDTPSLHLSILARREMKQRCQPDCQPGDCVMRCTNYVESRNLYGILLKNTNQPVNQ
jgi:hypothetical protein